MSNNPPVAVNETVAVVARVAITPGSNAATAVDAVTGGGPGQVQLAPMANSANPSLAAKRKRGPKPMPRDENGKIIRDQPQPPSAKRQKIKLIH